MNKINNRFSEYIKNILMKSNFYQGSSVIFDQGFYSITNFITSIMLARLLFKEEYGIYILAMSLIITILGIQRALISVPYTVYNLKYSQDKSNTYIGSSFIHVLLLFFITIIITMVFSKYFLNNQHQTSVNLFIFISFSFAAVGILLRDFVRSYLLAGLKIWRSIFMGSVINILQLSLISFLYIKKYLTIYNTFIIIGISSLVPVLIIFFSSVKLKIKYDRVWLDFINNFKLGKWILGSNTIFALSSQIYLWLLVIFSNKSSVAILGVTSSLANILGPFLQGINSYVFPKMTHARKDNMIFGVIQIMKKAVIFLSIIFGFWIVIGILFGNSLLNLIYSSKYSGYKTILIVVIINCFVSGITGPLGYALASLERADINFKSLTGGFIVTVFVGILLIYKFELYGAVIGMLLSNITNCILQWLGLLKLLKLTKKEMKFVNIENK